MKWTNEVFALDTGAGMPPTVVQPSGGRHRPGYAEILAARERLRSGSAPAMSELSQPTCSAPSTATSSRMRRQKTSGTQCELQVRRALHARGSRFRVDFRPLPAATTRVDIGWRGVKLAVFIDGCFWHRCPEHFVMPKTNAAWWHNKLQKNTERDRRIDGQLRQAGWTVLRFWEHEPPNEVAATILEARQSLGARGMS